VAFVSLKPDQHVTPEALLEFAAPLIAERPALPKRITIVTAIPMTAVGKVYKPRLRAQATRQAMAALLEQRGLGGQVGVEVEESAGGLIVQYTSSDETLDTTIHEMMKPFALKYAITRRALP
jgi:fatty-acyl-CoA synthase